MSRTASVLALLALAAGACGGKDYETGGNGVNDVIAACQLGATWNRAKDACSSCLAAARAPRCECPEFKEYSAACEDQETARRTEPSCSYTIEACAVDCGSDCACIDRCYANAPGCRAAAGARDGCVAEVCDKYCKP